MECIYCNNSIPEKANFCPKCKHQIKCLNCSSDLEKDSEICIMCGEGINLKSTSQNTIEFSETKKSRSFKASFSNEVGSNIGEALTSLLLNKDLSQFKSKLVTPERNYINGSSEYIEAIDTEFSDATKSTVENRDDKLEGIFNNTNGEITLLETRLKATSKRDYSIRLAIIFLYYKLSKGAGKVDRSDLNSIMKDASLYDGNFRYWLINNDMIGVHEDLVELKAPGREKAKEYINDIYDQSKTDGWKLGSATKKRKKKETDELSDD